MHEHVSDDRHPCMYIPKDNKPWSVIIFITVKKKKKKKGRNIGLRLHKSLNNSAKSRECKATLVPVKERPRPTLSSRKVDHELRHSGWTTL